MAIIDADLLIDALTLAAYSTTEESRHSLSEIIDIYTELTTRANTIGLDRDLNIFIDIIRDVIQCDVNLCKKSEINRVILKFKKSSIVLKDRSILDQVTELLTNTDDISEKRLIILNHRIKTWLNAYRVTKQITKLSMLGGKLMNNCDLNADIVLQDIYDRASEIAKIAEGNGGISETIDVVDMSDPASIAKTMRAYNDKRENNVFPTGLKGLNRMLGKHGGFRRGEFVAFAASSHNYKSGMLMDCARWCATLCEFKVAPGLTPCVVFISLENEVPENTWELVRRAYVCAYKEPVPKNMNNEELASIVAKYYNQKGVKFLMYRQDENFGFSDFVKLQSDLANKGYCVIASIIDYITLMRTDDTQDNGAKKLQKLAQQLANFFKRQNQLGITGLQLDSRADELNSSGRTNIVREYGAIHLADAKGLKRELDVLIFMHIQRNQDEVPYLTLAWNKHRDEPPPSKEDQYTAYRFCGPLLGIQDDINLTRDLSVTDIYSDKNSLNTELEDNPNNQNEPILF